MSGNCDENKRSGHAGVHTNPTIYQPVTSTSIHGRNSAGNHGGYSSSITEKSTSGENRDMYIMENTPLSSNSEQYTFGQNIPRDSVNSSDFDVWLAPHFSGR